MKTRVVNDRHIFVNDGKEKWYFNVLQMEFFTGLLEWKPAGWFINFVNKMGIKTHVELDHEPTPQELYSLL